MTELIAACGFGDVAAEVDEHSFTNALVQVLERSSEGPAFSTFELHSRIMRQLKKWVPSPMKDAQGRYIRDHRGRLVMEPQRRSTPVHCSLTHERSRRTILLAPLPVPGRQGNLETTLDGTFGTASRLMESFMSMAMTCSPPLSNGDVWPNKISIQPQIVITLKLGSEVGEGRHKPDSHAWLEWLRNAPPEAKEIEIGATPVCSGATHQRGSWSHAEDTYLVQLVQTQGALNWVRIAQLLGFRSPKQCRERYHQNLNPSLNHEPISPEEGLQIERLVAKIGKRWSEIARRLHGRSDNAVKDWWNASWNRRRRRILRQRGSLQLPYRSGEGDVRGSATFSVSSLHPSAESP